MQPSDDLIKYQEVIAALVQFSTEAEAVAHVGISRTTLYRWKKDPEFQRLFKEARQELYDHALIRVQAETSQALDTLHDVMVNSQQDGPRVSAAKAILEMSTKRFEHEEILDRLAAIEQADKEEKRGTK
ncbi:MAG: hypothetical protein KC800_05635 [Candidatus Eremiobacteraeota bacterium]|nr:hypothetical protein [Candidatus Eremiobacteraeota bacterium]